MYKKGIAATMKKIFGVFFGAFKKAFASLIEKCKRRSRNKGLKKASTTPEIKSAISAE